MKGNVASTLRAVLMPALVALAGLPAPPLVAFAEAAGRISPGMLAFLRESRRVDNRRMREELGIEPRYANLDAGIAACLAEQQEAQG